MPKSYTMMEWRNKIAHDKKLNQLLANQAVAEEKAPVVDSTPETVTQPEVTAETPAPEVEAVVAPAPATESVTEPVTEEVPEVAESESTDTVETVEEPITDVTALVTESTEEQAAEPVTETVTTTEVETAPEPADDTSVQEIINNLETNLKSKESSKKHFNDEYIHSRLGEELGCQYKGTFNPAVADFEKEAFTNNRILNTLTLPCDLIRRKVKSLGLWEEGGARNGRGTVLLVADANCMPKEVIVAYHNRKVRNGRHALISIDEGDHILVGCRRGNKYAMAIMRLVNPVLGFDKESCSIDAVCIADTNNLTEDAEDSVNIYVDMLNETEKALTKSDAEDATISGVLADLFTTGSTVLRTEGAISPAYVKKYRKFKPDFDDYHDATRNDVEFINSCRKCQSVTEVYADLDKVFDEYFKNGDVKGTEPVVTVDINIAITPKTHQEILMAHICGFIIDRNNHKSKTVIKDEHGNEIVTHNGRVFYAAVPIYADTGFYWPDEDPSKPHSKNAVYTWFKSDNKQDANGKYTPKVSGLIRVI